MNLLFIKYFNLITVMLSLNYLFLNQAQIGIYFLLINIAVMLYYYNLNIIKIMKQTIIYLSIAIILIYVMNQNMLSLYNLIFIATMGFTQLIFVQIISGYNESEIEVTLANTINNFQIFVFLLIVASILLKNELLVILEYTTYVDNYAGFIVMIIICLFLMVYSIELSHILYSKSHFYKTSIDKINVIK